MQNQRSFQSNRGRNRNGKNRQGGGRNGQGKPQDNFQQLSRALNKANQQRDKYLQMANDRLQGGDRVEAEHYFQHADHYARVSMSARKNWMLSVPNVKPNKPRKKPS